MQARAKNLSIKIVFGMIGERIVIIGYSLQTLCVGSLGNGCFASGFLFCLSSYWI
jgi:hypothetical protein